jgi:hypothetical protein
LSIYLIYLSYNHDLLFGLLIFVFDFIIILKILDVIGYKWIKLTINFIYVLSFKDLRIISFLFVFNTKKKNKLFI